MPSERQYKQRVKKWSLEKNIKDSDMKVILRKQMKRKLENDKESDFTIHGQPVQQHKIERYKQRKKVSPEEYMASTARKLTSDPVNGLELQMHY
jgi:hypothetical protein